MVYRFNSPSIWQHLIWVPVRSFIRIFARAEIRGLEHVRGFKCNAIIASNHVSELDPIMIVACLPFFSELLPLIYVVKGKQFYSSKWSGIKGLFYGGRFFHWIGGFEAFSGLNDYDKALPEHFAVLDKGWSVAIFPIGRMHRDTEFKKARGGVAYMSAQSGLPIIPVHIEGVDFHTSFWDYLRFRAKLKITFGEPISPVEVFDIPLSQVTAQSREECEAAASRVMEIIAKL